MPKGLAILALQFIVFATQGYAQLQKAQHGTNQKLAAPITSVAPIQQPPPRLPTEQKQRVDADVRVISSPEKDNYDRAAVWINFALAVIGVLGIGVGVFTLCYLRKQAAEMSLQRKVMVRSLRVMKEQGERENRSLILQYRPRVVVRFASASEFNPGDIGKSITARVRFTVVNTGFSTAYITGGQVSLWWFSFSASAHSVHKGAEIEIAEGALEAGQQYRWEETIGMDGKQDFKWANYHDGMTTDDRRTIVLVGSIYYMDSLNIPRSTGIYRDYDPKTKDFNPATAEGEYDD
jgi:hypothetical protein